MPGQPYHSQERAGAILHKLGPTLGDGMDMETWHAGKQSDMTRGLNNNILHSWGKGPGKEEGER